MAATIKTEEVQKTLEQVKHPAIDCTLLDLGIVKSISVDENKVSIAIAIPFAQIPLPIQDYLIKSVREPVENLGAEVEIETTLMNQEELQKFLKLEKENWKHS